MSVDIRSQEMGTVVFPPNKPLEVELEFSKTPALYDHIFFMDFNKNGESILGSSNVTGTFWEGTLMFFKNAKDMQDSNYCAHYIYSTTSDGKFVNENTIALAEDTGMLTILRKGESPTLHPISYFRTSQRIPQISVWDNSTKILACSDRTISIFDINETERKPSEKFENYHLAPINSVDTLKSDLNIFVSAASDRKACIWDLRAATPVSVIYSNEFTSLTSIAFNQIDNNYVTVGSQAGSVYLIDKRKPAEFVDVLNCFVNSIYRIAYNDSNQFAVCGDVNDVFLINCENNLLEVVYKNSEHKGYVRDLKWHEGSLYSCGFGKSIVKHVTCPK